MTSQTSKNSRSWRRVVSSGAVVGTLAASVMIGVGVSTAVADPEDSVTPCTGADCSKNDDAAAAAEATPTMTADQALAIIASDYDTGAGGGQLSNLVHQVMKLRSQGFKPSNANRLAIEEALNHRPNQAPLIDALKATLAYQRKLQSQSQLSVPSGGPVPVMVGGPTPGPMPGPAPGTGAQPGPTLGIPIG
jgi:hypothetical protein